MYFENTFKRSELYIAPLDIVNEDLRFTRSSTDKSYHPGFSIIRTWIQCAMKI